MDRMSQSPANGRRLSDSPWFWVYLFGAAALIAMFLIGQKADIVQAQRDGNFTRRQISLERQAGHVNTTRAKPDQAKPTSESETSEPRYVDFTIFYGLIGAVTVFAWIMHWRQVLQRRSVSSPRQASP
jgi:hypothetical protein